MRHIELIITIIITIMLPACSPKIVERVVEVPKVHTEYVTKHDTIIHKDSVFVQITRYNDTLTMERYIYKERIKVRTDTVIMRDTITNLVEVKEYVEINKLTKSQSRLITLGWGFIISTLMFVCIVVYRRYHM